jgi:hypothetical protein
VNGLRGHKGNIWENGIRSPLFVHHRGQYSPAVVDRLVDVTDLLPTMAALAGCGPLADSLRLDGRSILPYLGDPAAPLPGKEICLYANPGWPPTDLPWTPAGVKDEYRPWKYSDGGYLDYPRQILGLRTEQYKLLFNPGPTNGTMEPDSGGYVLIDVKNDPGENGNIGGNNPILLEEIQRQLKEWYASLYNDNHAFEMPVFKVGGETAAAYPVLAYAPHEVGPAVSNASNYISGFASPEDFARYRVNVQAEGKYDLEIAYEWKGERTVSMAFDLAGETRKVDFFPGKARVVIKKVPLARGVQDWVITPLSGSRDVKLYRFSCLPH